MKRIFGIILTVVILIVGIYFTIYPYLYNAYFENYHSKVTDSYAVEAERITDEEAAEIKAKVREYNESISRESVVLTDPFDPDILKSRDAEEYAEFLKIDFNDEVAVLRIPKIDLNLPVAYGTDEKTLAKELGILEGSSLPIGGESTHCVITGHTGLPNAKLFTDLTELSEGDIFYIQVLKDTLAYEIDNIAIVEPQDTALLKITQGEDYVTLLTCYPYGINSHRLLVRGKSVPYDFALEQEELMGGVGSSSSQWNREYIKSVIICVAAYGSIFGLIMFIMKRRKKKQR
ncbi:MAG: class C sortase [Clostridiales bacterium]|nr:class C sortase [Clostridiales bacterium]